MKIAYFYPSSPEIEFPDVLGIPPDPAIMVVESQELPNTISISLNFGIVGLKKNDPFSVHVSIYYNDEKLPSRDVFYAPFRHKWFASKSGMLAERYSVKEEFKASDEGVYTFKIHLFDFLSTHTDDINKAIAVSECSVCISREWR